jgi:CheY-like chemotaxis protein
VNLLSNAIDALRAIKPPRRLIVDSWASGGKVSVGVADNGQGVAPELLGRLFRPFATMKGRRGTGLGLYVSRQIVREAGGDLVLSAGFTPGARFVATLPATAAVEAPPSAGIPVAAAAPDLRLAGLRILLVDDEEGVRRPMAKFLNRRGAEVYEAGDGAQALAILDREPVDVILADLRMPRMSGTELFSALQVERPQLATRVLFLSGDVSQLADPGSTPVPRERVLVKPVELAELERRVAEFVAASERV